MTELPLFRVFISELLDKPAGVELDADSSAPIVVRVGDLLAWCDSPENAFSKTAKKLKELLTK